MPAGRPSQYFVVAVFVSMVMHAFLLWVVATVRTAVEPTALSIGTPMIVSLVSLSTLATASHDGLGREAVSAEPDTGPPAQRSQSSPERYRSAERKVEAESVVTSKGQGVPDSEAPEDKSLATDATPSIDLEAAYSIAREVGRMPESEAETVVSAKNQGGPGSEAPEGKSFATGAPPPIDLEAAFRIAREVGREWESMSALTTQSPRFTSRELYLKNHLGVTRAPPPDCNTAYAGMGFIAIPLLLKDAITGSGCEWKRQADREREGAREKKSGKEVHSDLTNKLIFGEFAYPVDSGGKLSW